MTRDVIYKIMVDVEEDGFTTTGREVLSTKTKSEADRLVESFLGVPLFKRAYIVEETIQKEQKPTLLEGNAKYRHICSTCKEKVESYFHYCPKCGQLLNWRD